MSSRISYLVFAAVLVTPLTGQNRQAITQQRTEWNYRQRAYPRQSIPPDARVNAIREMERMKAREDSSRKAATARGAGADSPVWTLIGPRPENVILTPPYGAPIAAGRVSALAVDPRDNNTVYLGGASGGVWKTTDGGLNWAPLTDDQPSLAIGSIALAPSNPDIIYVGTGEQNNSGDSYYGAGILKSTDRGATWEHLPGAFTGPFSSTFSGGGYRLGAIAVHPSNPDIVLAGGSREVPDQSGIFRSTDGGRTWSPVLTGSAGTEVFFDPTNGSTAYAAIGRGTGDQKYGVYKSTDGGATWTASNGTGSTALPANQGRIAMAMAPSNPSVLYVGMSSTGGSLRGFFRSADGARTWTALPAPDYCAPQCQYDNVVRVHPVRSDVVVVGGDAFGSSQSNGIYRTLNGGTTWTSIFLGPNGYAPHTDHHALAFSSDGTVLYDGNDGGAHRASDVTASPVNWTNLNTTLAITSMSPGFAIDPINPKLAYSGTQDNGTLKYTGSLAWDQVFGGDGEQAQVDFSLPAFVYVTTPGANIYKITDQGNFQDYVAVTHGINPQDRTAFTSAFTIDPSDPQRLYFGTYRVYQTNDGAGLWQAISPDLTNETRSAVVSTIAVAPSDPNVVYAGTTNSLVQVTSNALDGTAATWAKRNDGLPPRSVTWISVDPVQASTAYVGFSGFSGFKDDNQGHIFKTTDAGSSWIDISGNLPNIPVNDIVVDPDVANTLYVGTDIGVFTTSDGGATWATVSSGLPRTVILGLKLHRRSRTLRAATHGRSMWDLAVPIAGASTAPTIVSGNPVRVDAGSAAFTISITGTNFNQNSIVRWNGRDRATTFVNGTTLQAKLLATDVATSGRGTIVIFNPGQGGGNSNALNVVIGPAPSLTAAGVVNPANPLGGSVLVPGSIATIYGTNLAPVTESAVTPPLPTTLGGVKVEINGSVPVPLLFVSPNQINFQVPWRIAGFATGTLTVTNGVLTSNPVVVNIANYAPGLYSVNSRGSGQGAVLISGSGGQVAAPAGTVGNSRPVKKGEYIEIYANGLGDVTLNPATGSATPSGTLAITRTPTVTIGGVAANVQFSGLTPGAVGLFQVNVQVPDSAPSGPAVPVTLEIGGVQSNTVTIAIE